MQNIYEKIDTMFSGQNDDKPQWAVEILQELHEIKELLQQSTQPKQYNIPSNNHTPQYSSIVDKHRLTYFEFIQDLRQNYNDAVSTDDILWKNQRLGISEGGLIYNKNTNRIYSTEDARIIYKELYNLSINNVQCVIA